MASFGLIAGIGAVQQTTSDNQSGSQAPSGDSASTSASLSTSVSASASASASTSTSASNASNGSSTSSTTPTVADTPANYQAQITQGQQDAYAGKASAASSLSGRAADYYTAAYNGAKAAMAAYATATQSKGAGTQDYTYYGNTASKLNDDGSTHTSTNTTDGTPQQAGSTDDVNQGGANNPTDASNSSSKYESTLNGNLNTASNTSVKGNSTSNQISIPTSKTDTIVAARSSYQNDTNLGTTFDNAVNYVLGQYGQQDAETGKWQGVYNASNKSATQDWYLTTNPNSDTTNAYDQAYRGARAAMGQYFDKNNNYLGNGSVKTSSTNNTYYDQGFNDVVSQAAQGIAYVQNGYQYVSVLTGNTNTTTGGNVASNINTIRLANDIDLTGAGNGENNLNVSSNTATFTVDGQNHLMDAHGNGYIIGGSLSNLFVQNFQTIYGANYFGPFRGQNGSSVHFGNLNYVGPQLLSSYNNDAYFFGNVNVIVPNNSTATYTSPFQSNVGIEGGGNQENLEVKNFVLQSGAHYYGTTSPVKGGTNMVVQGNFTMQSGSKMTLVSRGGDGNAASDPDGSTFGIWLQGSGSALNIQKDATLNIIPSKFNGNSYMIGGGIYADGGAQVTVDGGTINYEGKGGQSGSYNEPIDLKGSNTTIKVINGGLLQVLMDSVPTYPNPTSARSDSYYGFVTNYGGGSFNIGSKGSLNIGITNSDTNKGTPYYGPLNINSVGENHVIITKPAGATQFSQSPITAYTVAVVQGGQKTYLYQYNLQPGASTYSGIDLNGNTVSGPVTGNTIDIANVPAVQFVGPLTTSKNADGTLTVTGYAKLSNYKDLNGQPLYVGVASGNGGSSYTDLTQIAGDNLTDGFSSADPYTYTTKIDTSTYDGGIIPVSYKLPAGVTAANSLGMRLRYGINSVTSFLSATGNYSTTVEGFKAGANGKVAPDTNGNMVVTTGKTSTGQSGISDGVTDSINGNSAAKSAEPYATQTDNDYTNGYNSAQDGYKAYSNQTANEDYTKTDAYRNSSNPSAYTQGYNAAAYQAGLHDAQLNQNNVPNNTNYQQAQSEYKAAYANALANPTATAPAGSTAATVQGYADAKGVSQFFADEQAGTIQGSNYKSLNASQQTSYNNAYTGYQQAMTVKPTADNPDTNATLAETAGFDYGQSLINGGLSTSRPTATGSHMNNLNAAQIGYDTAQAAIKTAKANYQADPKSAEVTATDPSQLSADKTSDTTFNRYVKFGAYTGLKGQSDGQLNQYEEVGYSPIVSGDAYKAGMAAYQNNGSATPTSPYSNSNAGTAAYNQGYNDAKNAENAGVQNFKNGTGHVSGTDTASQITNTAYDNAQKGFTDGAAGTTATSSDPAYVAGHNAGDATKQAIADSKSGTTTPATPADSAAYADAKQAYADGAKAAAAAAKSGTTPAQSTSSDPVYKQAYNQALTDAAAAQKQAIQDAEDNHGKDIDPTKSYSANSDVQALAKQAYADAQTGYKNALSGSTTTPTNAAQQSGSDTANTDKAYADAEVNNTTPSSTPSTEKQQSVSDAITAAKKALAADPGASDTLPADSALANDPLAAYTYKKYIDNATADYKKGIDEAKAGTTPSDNASAAEKQGASDFNTGFNNGNGATNITNPNSGQQAGIDAAKSVAQGVEDAQKGTDDSNVTDPIQKEAATYANQAFTDYASGGTPKTDAQINALDPIAKAAYLQAKSAIQNAASNGAQEFLDGKTRPDTTTKTGATEAAGYDDAQSGYNAAKAGTTEDQLTPAQKADTNFMKGYQAYKDSQTGYNATTAPDSSASQAQQDGYNGAAAGTKDAIAGQPKADVSGKSKAYQDAYNTAYNQATDGYNDGYAAGKSGAAPDPTKKNDPNYMKGYNAGKSAQQAITDGENGVTTPSTTPTDQAAYTNAAKAYADGAAAGKTDPSTSTDPIYKAAYNQAINDTAAARQAAIKDASDRHGQDVDPTKSYSANPTVQAAAKQAYADAQKALTDTLAGNAPTNPNDAQTAGTAAANNDKSYVADTIAGKTPSATVSDDSAQTIKAQVAAAQAAVAANPDASDELNSKDPLANYAYKQAFDAAKAKYDNGVANAAKAQATDPSADAATKQGADDFSKGLTAAVNGQTIANPTSGEKAGMDAAKSFNQGYTDGEKGTDDSNVTDPVQKAAAAAAKEALTDYANGSPKGTDDINKMDPVSKAAYQKALDDAKGLATQGQNAFTNGTGRPDDSTPAGKVAAAAYDKAKQGYEDAAAGKTTDADKNDPAYQAGQKAYTDSQTGYNGTTTPADNASQPTKDAYNGATSGAADAVAGKAKPADLATKSQAYQDAYNKAYDQAQKGMADATAGTQPTDAQKADPNYMTGYNAAQKAAQSGSQAYLNGQARPDDSTPTGKAAAAAYDKAKQGYEDAAAGKTTAADQDDPAYQAGEKAYKDTQTGYNGTSAPADNASQQTKDAYNGATSGAADAVAGKAKPADLATKSQAYQDAYNKAYDQAQKGMADATAGTQPTDAQKADPNYMTGYNAAQKAAQSGSQAYLNGQARPDDSTPTGKAAAAAYDKAKQGYEDAAAGKTTAADQDDPAYQAGEKAYKDTQTGYNGTSAPADNASQQTKDAYNGATSGAADAVAGKAKPADLATKSQAYQDAYNKAYDQAQKGMADVTAGTQPTDAQKADPNYMTGYNAAQKAADNGAQAFLNGQARPDDSTPTGKAAAAAYDAAKKGYTDAAADAQSGKEPTDAQKADPSYMKGYQAYKDSQTGYTGAGTDTKPAADAPQAAQDAYNGAIAGAKDGAAGAPKESDLATKSQAYQDAYNKAYDDAAAGAKAGYQDGSQSGTPTDLTNKSAIYKQAYAAAKAKADAEATAGAADFAQGKSAPTTATAASQYGYDRAKAGFDDANAGKPAQSTDAAYMAGYNAGLKHYTTVNNTAQDDALSGKGRQDANLDDADKAAYDQAYARTIAGLNDGANGAAKAYPDDANYLKGYAAGQAVKALLADKQNNTKTAVDDQASYDLANQAYLQAQDDVKNGRAKAPNNQNPVYVLAYDLAYDQLLKEKEAQGTATSAEPTATTTTDNVTPATKSSVLPATGEEKTAANNSGLILGLAASFLGLFAAAKRNKRDEK
ncbi:hypothetical protein [Fructobacillus tropaeoli]|uniref:Gram-positive cocci surface proteins LPxTG domain-containing protein n=1 Tax=Fructobacillus tropaeoli TaxID=709323 RepID=A0ABM9N162_9LACO|nr:hypothetical protein R53137_KAKDMLNK_01483 [Fructobacillus tropaeoli]